MTATIRPVMTEQKYLKLEEQATVRHEFINGKMSEMPGGTLYHGAVVTNTGFALKAAGLRAFIADTRLRLPQTGDYFYPDVLVAKEKISKAIYAERPLLIAEVLSPSTRTNDFTDKFIAYRQFPSLLYYLLVEPDFCYATLFSRNEEGIWESEVYNQLNNIVPLPQLFASLPLAGIYEDLEWANTPDQISPFSPITVAFTTYLQGVFPFPQNCAKHGFSKLLS